MSLGPLTCDKRRDRDLQDGRSRESIRCKYLHPSPPSKRDEEGGGNKRRRVSIKTPEGESFTPASESIVRGTVTPDACVGIIACGVFAGCFCVRAKHGTGAMCETLGGARGTSVLRVRFAGGLHMPCVASSGRQQRDGVSLRKSVPRTSVETVSRRRPPVHFHVGSWFPRSPGPGARKAQFEFGYRPSILFRPPNA